MTTKTTTADKAEATDLVNYEIMAIIEPDITEAQYKKHVDALKTLLKKGGAEIWNEQEWGKRDFAYIIKKQDSGFYVVLNFKGDPSAILELENQLRITPFVLRHLIIKTPDGYQPVEYDWDAELEERVEEKPKVAPEPVKAKKAEVVKEEVVKEEEVVEEPVEEAAKEEEVVEEPVEEVEEPVEEVAKEEVAEEPVEEVAKEEVVEEEVAKEEVVEEEDAKEEEVVEEEAAKEEEVVEEEVVEEVAKEEAPAKEEKETKEEIVSDKVSSERLSKLDEKLEELLSGDDDLNL